MLEKAKIFGREGANFPVSIFMDMKFHFTENEIEYLWTKDKHLLRQYTKLIDDSFEEELNFPDSYKNITPDDLSSFFYLGLHNESVVAGVRLSISKLEFRNLLPSETLGFRYSSLFNELDIQNSTYCEVTRYASIKNFRNMKSHYYNSFKNYKEKMDENNAQYLFLPSSKSRIRLYNRFAEKYFDIIDVKQVKSFDNVKNTELDIFQDFYVVAYKNKN